jgi:hypothetical protein
MINRSNSMKEELLKGVGITKWQSLTKSMKELI